MHRKKKIAEETLKRCIGGRRLTYVRTLNLPAVTHIGSRVTGKKVICNVSKVISNGFGFGRDDDGRYRSITTLAGRRSFLSTTMSCYQPSFAVSFLLLILCLVSRSLCSSSLLSKYLVKKHIFHSVVDHYSFRPTPHKTFPLRYYVSDEYYNHNSTSPCFFYAGNEADIWQFINNTGFLFQAAKEFGALVVFAEHRYYGESKIQPHDMSFLTVEQAMADFNTLNVHIRNKWNMPSEAAFVVFGGSYGGNLAMWLRLKNPNLWAGAIASSATPLKHILRETNDFARIETDVYMMVSLECPDIVREGYKTLFNNAASRDNRVTIQEELHLCHVPPDEATVRNSIYGWISGALETMVQYGYPYPTEFYNPLPAWPFKVACTRMLQAENCLAALRAAVDVYYNHTGQAGPCFDLDFVEKEATRHWQRKGNHQHLYRHDRRRKDQLKRASNIRPKQDRHLQNVQITQDDDDAWGYQTCTEVYQPMPTNGITDFEMPYTPNQTEYFEHCRQRWNVEPRPDWEEMNFMGANIQAGSNIFLASGQLDPWRAAGIQENPRGAPDSIIIRIIEDGAHHLDLRESNPADPPSVVKVRREQKVAMRQWIAEWKEACPLK